MEFIESLPPSLAYQEIPAVLVLSKDCPGELLTDHCAALASRVSDEVKNARCLSESPMLIRNAGIPGTHRSKDGRVSFAGQCKYFTPALSFNYLRSFM
jgi:hypothetical protein